MVWNLFSSKRNPFASFCYALRFTPFEYLVVRRCDRVRTWTEWHFVKHGSAQSCYRRGLHITCQPVVHHVYVVYIYDCTCISYTQCVCHTSVYTVRTELYNIRAYSSGEMSEFNCFLVLSSQGEAWNSRVAMPNKHVITESTVHKCTFTAILFTHRYSRTFRIYIQLVISV